MDSKGRPAPSPHTCIFPLHCCRVHGHDNLLTPGLIHSPCLDSGLLQTRSCPWGFLYTILQPGHRFLQGLSSLLSLVGSPSLLNLINLEICDFTSYFWQLHLQDACAATSSIVGNSPGSAAPPMAPSPDMLISSGLDSESAGILFSALSELLNRSCAAISVCEPLLTSLARPCTSPRGC